MQSNVIQQPLMSEPSTLWLCVTAEACFDSSSCLSVFQAANQWYVNRTHALESLCCGGLVLCCLIVNSLNLVCIWCCDTETCRNYCLSFLILLWGRTGFNFIWSSSFNVHKWAENLICPTTILQPHKFPEFL